MKPVRLIAAAIVAVVTAATAARTQEMPKPGPEHAQLKKLGGDWDTTFKMAGQESTGKATYKMEVGGLWLVSKYEGEVAGMKFYGRGLDSYDAGKKKFVSVWVDNMSTSPMVMEGTYDKATKTLTLSGKGPGEGGKPTEYRSESQMPDDNTINFRMYVGGGNEPAFTILYKRKK